MPFGEPGGCLFRLELHVVLAGPDLHLDAFRFGDVDLGFDLALFLVFGVLVPPVVHDLGDRGYRVRRNLDQIQPRLFCLLQRLRKR